MKYTILIFILFCFGCTTVYVPVEKLNIMLELQLSEAQTQKMKSHTNSIPINLD